MKIIVIIISYDIIISMYHAGFIPRLDGSKYDIGPVYDTQNQIVETKRLYHVKNHPDKLLKLIEIPKYILTDDETNIEGIYGNLAKCIMDQIADTRFDDYPWNEVKISYIAGKLGVGAKIYGCYICKNNQTNNYSICMIMDLIQGVNVVTMEHSQIQSVYNKTLKTAEILIDNGIKHENINPTNVILQSDGNIKILDYASAYEIRKPHPSKKEKLIKAMVLSINPSVFGLMGNFVEDRINFIKRELPYNDYYIDNAMLDPELIPPNTIYEGEAKNMININSISLTDNSLFFYD